MKYQLIQRRTSARTNNSLTPIIRAKPRRLKSLKPRRRHGYPSQSRSPTNLERPPYPTTTTPIPQNRNPTSTSEPISLIYHLCSQPLNYSVTTPADPLVSWVPICQQLPIRSQRAWLNLKRTSLNSRASNFFPNPNFQWNPKHKIQTSFTRRKTANSKIIHSAHLSINRPSSNFTIRSCPTPL